MLQPALRTLMSLAIGILASAARAEEVRRPDLLLTAADAKQRLEDSAYRLLDVRDAAAYATGHVPGAVSLDLPQWTKQSRSVAGLLERDFWAPAVGNLGIDRQTRVLVYGADAASAARAWWLLEFVGVKSVSLLDGGWQAWQAAGYPVATETPQLEPRKFELSFQRERLMDMAELLRGLDNPRLQVLDTRSRGEYTGEDLKGSRAGRVPGAMHLEWVELLDESGRFKKPAELKSLLAERGIKATGPVVTYCYSGGRASVAAFAFELLGLPQVKNYYCGWQEWSATEKAPAQTDAAPKE
jgi:thiosulfate/3-mercaptopyruvate sulfurtransferase